MTFGKADPLNWFGSNIFRKLVDHGPTARTWTVSVASWGAEVSVSEWYSSLPSGAQAKRIHWPDRKSKLIGRLNSSSVTSNNSNNDNNCSNGNICNRSFCTAFRGKSLVVVANKSRKNWQLNNEPNQTIKHITEVFFKCVLKFFNTKGDMWNKGIKRNKIILVPTILQYITNIYWLCCYLKKINHINIHKSHKL